jgi:UDP-N-acetylmuramate dehydrogenase
MNGIEILSETARLLGCEVRRDEPMSRHTTFRIGGPAELFLTAPDLPALKGICQKAAETGIPILPLGNGSNLLVSDAGIHGAVVTLGSVFRKISLVSETSILCGTAASIASLCDFAKSQSLTGAEFAWGIPGSMGGAVFMNAGAYGHCVSEIISFCSHITKDGKEGTLSGSGLDFGYRHSAYSSGGFIITAVRVELKHGVQAEIAAQMDEIYTRRKAKQPLDLPSAGSVFKRPKGHYAGMLIEQCGLKGRRVGGAAVSEKHAGFIVNLGGATCADVEKLIAVIQETVLRETGVTLECEVRKAG